MPTEASFVISNQYRPNLYSQISSPFVNVQAGEGIKDFYDDCCNILAAAGRSLEEGVDALVDGLNAVIKAHIARCGSYLCWRNQLAIANKANLPNQR